MIFHDELINSTVWRLYATGNMNLNELHTISTNLKATAINKIDIYTPRLAQILNENFIDYINAPRVPRHEDRVDPDFDWMILQPFGLQERIFAIDPYLLQEGKDKQITKDLLKKN